MNSVRRLFVLLSLSSILLSSVSPAFAAEANEQQFMLKLEWGVFNPDGTPATGMVDPSLRTNFEGDVSFHDSIGVLVRPLGFERGEDRINSTSDTITTFQSTVSGATDGLLFHFTGNFADGMSPSLYYHTQHEGRNVTLSLADLMADSDQKLEYVIDTDSRFKIFISIVPAL